MTYVLWPIIRPIVLVLLAVSTGFNIYAYMHGDTSRERFILSLLLTANIAALTAFPWGIPQQKLTQRRRVVTYAYAAVSIAFSVFFIFAYPHTPRH